MPVILQCEADDVSAFGPGERIALTNGGNEVMAFLDVSEVYPLETDSVIERWFGTATRDHPGVRRILDAGERCVAGEVTLVEPRPTPHRHFELSPAQTRFIFTHKGWSRVVGFHTRNVCHRVHEYIQIQALEQTNADGLYVSPVIGPKKAGDFLPEPIMKSYQALWETGDADANGNVTVGDVMTHGVRGSYIRSDKPFVAAVGVEDLIVVATDDAVLVVAKDRAQDVRVVSEWLKDQGRAEFDTSSRVYRPWGFYQIIDSGEKFQAKQLMLNPAPSSACNGMKNAPNTGSWSKERPP